MSLSIVIVAHNRLSQLQRTIISWSDYDELLIVNDGSDDGTSEWLREHYPEVRLIDISPHPYRNCAVAKNIGVANAIHDLVLVQDAEIEHINDATNLIHSHLERRTGILVTPQAILFEQWGLRPHTWRDSERYSVIGMHKADYIAIGGMNEHYTQWGNEDNEFAVRCETYGYELVTDERIKTHHFAHKPEDGDPKRFLKESKFQGVYAKRLKEGKAKPVLPWRY